MLRVVRIFMERDGMTKREAIEHYKELRSEIMETLQDGGGYNDIEDILLGESLEMDYAMDFI